MGIDLGSTSIKAVIYDYNGNHIASGAQTTPLSYLDSAQPSWCVWEPDKIWDCVVKAIREALSQIGNADEVLALAVTGFGMDGLPVDKNGNPLYPMISWHCPRTNPQCERFSAQVGAKHIFDITGKQVMSIDSIYRMMWIQEHHPEIMERTDKWLLIEDFINFLLCGEQATDYSMATCTSVYDHTNKRWSEELINAAGVPLRIFPKVMQSGTVLGNISCSASELTGLSPETKVVLGGHDYICGAFAVGAIDDSVLMDITGTWEMLVQASSTLNTSQNVFNSGYYLEGHVLKNKYCYVGSSVSGDMTEWLKNVLYSDINSAPSSFSTAVWEDISRLAELSPCASNGCMFLPHFSGAGAPRINPNSMGAFVGLHNQVTKPDMIRAVFEGLDYQFKMMVLSFTDNMLGNVRKIVATGGAAKNKFWMQNKADVTGLPLYVPEVYEATPLGAAMLAGVGSGIYKDENHAVQSVKKNHVTYEPNFEMNKRYEDYYDNVYSKLQQALENINCEISSRAR